jgi:serine/threonine-protein kinase HipA
MRKSTIYYKDLFTEILTETDEGEYVFQYDEKYIKELPKQFLTFIMHVSPNPHAEKRLFPFF